MTIGNDACNGLNNGVADTPENTLSSHRSSLTRKKKQHHISLLISGLISSQHLLLCVSDCGTSVLLVTIGEAAKLEVLGAVVSAVTKDWLASGSVGSSGVSLAVSLSIC